MYIGKSHNILYRMAQHYAGMQLLANHKYRVLSEARRYGHRIRFFVLYTAAAGNPKAGHTRRLYHHQRQESQTACCAYHACLAKGVDKIQCLRGGLFYAAGDGRFLFSVKSRAAAHKFSGREHHQTIWTGNRGCPRVAAHLPPFLRPTAGENGNRPLYHLSIAGT